MSPHPNLVWIFLDQCRADVLGCYGHPFIQTPNIDRLAASGVLFENAFCQNPVCVPSRASILSGRYSHQVGVYDNTGQLQPEDSHLLNTYRQAGYRTANVGKVHVGLSPAEMGFQEHREIDHDGIPHFHVPADYPQDWPWKAFDVPGYPQPVIYATDMCPRERTYSAVGVSQAIDIFQNHAYQASPLLLRLSLDRPHTPVSSPKPYDALYAEQTGLPDYPDWEQAGQPSILRRYIQDRRWDHFSDDEILKSRYYYYGLVTHLDHELGRLLDVIEQSPQRENTVFVLAADHGCMLGEHGMYVKCPHYYTQTARVPLLIAWPGHLPAGLRLAGLAEMVDLLPTLCQLCDLPIPLAAIGRSLVPWIQGAGQGREEVFAEQYSPGDPLRWVAVRTQRYAYTLYPNAGEEMLFDLDADPAEQVNLMRQNPPQELITDLQDRIRSRLDLT